MGNELKGYVLILQFVKDFIENEENWSLVGKYFCDFSNFLRSQKLKRKKDKEKDFCSPSFY